MTVLLILAVVASIFLRAIYRTVTGRIHREGLSLLIVRWLLGKPWHGEPLTDAGWSREGKRALTKTGHASRWAHRPQRERVAWRFGITAAVLATLYGLLFDRGITILAMKLGLAAAVMGAGLLVWRSVRLRKYRKSRLMPLHNALTTIVRKGLPTNPEKWLAIDRGPEVRWVEITLPDEFAADHHQVKAICAAATARLGMDRPKPVPRFAGAKPVLRLEAVVPPPKKLLAVTVMPKIEAAKPHQIVLGMGEDGVPTVVSLEMESPHLGLSVGSGGGKSVAARLIGAQSAYRGATLLILDFPKLVSLRALRGLPNVAYCDSAALVHAACVWLAHELEDRAALVKEHTDDDEVYRGPHIPRLLLIAEESNALFNRLRAYWSDMRAIDSKLPRKSPAIDGLELALFMGRQLHVNVVQIGQMLTTKATGSGEARENLGIRILGRATENNWKVMVPEHPYPGKTVRPGRVHVVTDACVETQIAFASPREARALAVAGTVTPCPRNMPGRPGVLAPVRRPVLEYANGPDLGNVLEPELPVLDAEQVVVLDGVTLPQAVEMGISRRKQGALNRASTRPGFPTPVGRRGNANLYDPDALAKWDAGQR